MSNFYMAQIGHQYYCAHRYFTKCATMTGYTLGLGRTQGGLGLKTPLSLIYNKNSYYLRKGD